jgi:uncharacterized RDD family membrane protein YckC
VELLEMTPPAFGIRRAGIRILDDDGLRVHAGPFGVCGHRLARCAPRRCVPDFRHAEHVR